jgi:ribosomal protein L35AE/L33A
MFGAVAGAISSSSNATSSLTVTAGTRAVTGFSAPEAAAITVGELIVIPKNTVANVYFGRVTRVSGTTVYVSPTPTQSFTSTAGNWSTQTLLQFVDLAATGTSSWRGAQGGASWQNRLIFGGVTRELQSAVYEHLQNRVIWSLLPTETSAALAGADGDLFLSHYGWPANNYADVPWMNAVLGLEPVSDGELLITGRPLCSRLVGTLNTNTSTSGGLTYELRPLNQRIPCISDRATVRTPQGTMVMGPDGIYLYREGNLINTMVGRIQNLFLDTYASATVYGAGVLPSNHYFLSTEQGLLLCNMDGFRWTKFQNTAITNAFNDPSNTGRVFACRYQPGTASNTTKLVRADYLVNPSSAAVTDVSGTGPLMTVKTKTYIDGDASRLKQFRHEEVTVRMPGSTGTVTVTSQPGLDGEETGATLGTISNATSAQSKRYDTTTISRAMGLQIAQTGNPDECELVDVDIAPRPLRAGRVA